MSINAEISKKLVISSPDELFNYIKDKNSFLEKYIEFKIFRDLYFLYKYGCPCDSEENERESSDIYKRLNEINIEAFVDMKKDIGCSNIIFKLNNEILFEI